MLYGYARVSSTDQDLSIQIAALQAAGCAVVGSEKKSGTTTEGRAEPATLFEFLREGDTLVVTRLDRLARSVADLQTIAKALRDKGVALRTTDGMAFDTSTAMCKCFLDMLEVFAELKRRSGASARWRGSPRRSSLASTRAGQQRGPQGRRPRPRRDRAQGRHIEGECVSLGARATRFTGYPMTPKWQVYLGDEVMGRPSGYPSHKAAQAAARRLADEHGALPYEIRPVNHVARAEDEGADFLATVERRPRAR